ncbi:DUF222 domain-containing protein [Glutamicibacter arilaitensis]|uniref:HNH endonuclease signature motif containing protein n=1 Tax=Glutamicibacter arilaitensis TaxID=256701 RepID=UPI00384B126E
MNKREVFHSGDDPHRLHISPPGTRNIPGTDGVWAAHVEQDTFFAQLAATTKSLHEQGRAIEPATGLKQLEILGRIRSMLDAAEAALLADTYELTSQQAALSGTQELLVEDPAQAQSAEHFGVDPAAEPLIRASFISEASGALRQGERIVQGKLFNAEGLRHLCPETLNELGKGTITIKSATEIVHQAQDLEAEHVKQMQEVLLPIARTGSDRSVKDRARKMRERFLPEPAETRHEKGRETRSVTWWPEADGMAVLQIRIPAEDALAIINTINWHATKHDDPDDLRNEQQRRADIFRDALLDGWPAGNGTPLKARVALTIPVLQMLTDPTRTLADLEGYGPIALGAALRLAKDAPSLMTVLTDPWSGAVIDVGRKKYRPTKALKDLLRLRDNHCRFPGCNRLPESSEVDHVDDWAKGGHTNRDNSQLLCKRHQMYKHALGWQATYMADGSVNWRSPNGILQVELPGSVTNVQNFDFERSQTPMLPASELPARVRRVLGWFDPPDSKAG